MAICRIIETGATPDEYEKVRGRLGLSQGQTPPGASLHIAARGDDGKIRVIEVWDSRAESEDFGAKVRAAREEVGLGGSAPPITYLDVHNIAQS